MSSSTGSVFSDQVINDEKGGQVQVTFGPDSAGELLRVMLIRFRDIAKINQGEAAKRIGIKTQGAISNWENGYTIPLQEHLIALLDCYGQSQHIPLLVEVRRIAVSTKRGTGDKSAVALGVVSGVELLYGLEYLATSFTTYEPRVVTGLLQTEDTITAMMRRHAARTPGFDADAEIAKRLTRQQILYRRSTIRGDQKPLHLVFYIEESSLRRIVGDPRITADQLEFLARANDRSNIAVHVIPDSATMPDMDTDHDMPDFQGAICLLTMPDDWSMCYAPTFHSAHYYATPDALEHASRLLGQLRTIALNKSQSQALMSTMAEEIRAS